MLRIIASFIITWLIAVYVLTPLWKTMVKFYRSEKARMQDNLTTEEDSANNEDSGGNWDGY